MNPRSFPAAAMALAVCCACEGPAQPPPQTPSTTVWQVRPGAMLLAGNYDSVTTAGEMRQHGAIGVATPGAADGELTMIGGRVYHTRGKDARARHAPDRLGVAFSIVTGWDDRDSRRLRVRPGLDSAAFVAAVDAQLPTTNAFYALVMKGTWSQVVVRNLERQSSPYLPFGCSSFAFDTLPNVKGTMVGFREPPYAYGLGVPDYHLHFISEDGSQGGHVLGFVLGSVTLNVSRRPYFTLLTPPDSASKRRCTIGDPNHP